MTLGALQQKISRVRAMIKLLFTLDGLFKLVLILAVFIILSFLLDYFLKLPATIRSFLLLLGICLHLWAFFHYLWHPLARHIHDDVIVLALEKKYPQLNDQLISAVQFTRLVNRPEYQDSPTMTQAAISEGLTRAKALSFTSILAPGKVLSSALVPLSLLAVIMLYSWQFPMLGQLWWQRDVLLQNVSWPRKTRLFLLKKEFFVTAQQPLTVNVKITAPLKTAQLCYRVCRAKGLEWQPLPLRAKQDKGFQGNLPVADQPLYFYLHTDLGDSQLYRVTPLSAKSKKKQDHAVNLTFPDHQIVKAKGNDLLLAFVAVGKVPSSVWLFSQGVQDNNWQRVPLSFRGLDTFRYSFQALTNDLRFYVIGGDDDDGLPIYQVKVLTPPSVQQVLVWYHYPAYTHQAPTPKQSPQHHGNLNAIIGSTARLEIHTNIPIKTGRIVFAERHAKMLAPVILKICGAQRRCLQAQIPIKFSTRYTIHLVAQNNLADPNPTSFYVRAVQDHRPLIRILAPGKSLDMTPQGNLPIRLHTRDDFGIAKIVLRYKCNQEKNWRSRVLTLVENQQTAYPAREIFSQLVWEMKSVQTGQEEQTRPLQPGDLLTYHFQAYDQNNVTGPGIGETEYFSVNLTSKGDLERILNERLLEIKRELLELKKLQQEKRDSLSAFLEVDEKIEASDLARLLNLQIEQRQIGRDADRQALAVKEIVDAIENNQLWDSHTKQRLTQVQNLLWSIGKEHLPGKYQGKSHEVARWLIKGYKQKHTARTAILQCVRKGRAMQDEIIAALDKAVELLERWEDYNEIIQSFRSLIEQQERVNRLTQQALQKH